MAFKMKNPSMAKMAKMAGSSRTAMKMKMESAAKMKKEAAMKLKKEAPMKMKKDSSMKMGHKSPAKLKDMSDKSMYGDKMAKAIKEGPKSTKGKTNFKGGMKKMSPADIKKLRDRSKKSEKVRKFLGPEPKGSAAKFNAKLKAASKAGKLSGKFKEAVDAAPVKMKKSPAKLTKNLKEVGKITKAQLQGKTIRVVDGGSKMAKRAKADYEKQQKAKAEKAKKKAEFKRVEAENIKRSREKAKNLGMTMKEYEKMLKRKQRKQIFGF